MKTTLATALSVTGVLAAGAAAFAVNSSVLGGTASTGGTAKIVAPADTSAVQPAGNVSAQDESLVVPDTSATATPVDGTTTTYKVGAAGSVVISTASGSLTVASVAPALGWTAEPPMTQADGSVKVHFSSSTTRLEFLASLSNGKVNVSVTSDNNGPSALPGSKDSHLGDDKSDDETSHHDDGDGDHDSGGTPTPGMTTDAR